MGNRIKILSGFLALLSVGQSSAADINLSSSAQASYIEQWHEEAVRQMAIHRIPASITLAQGLLESGSGNSELARKSNNHFGIKCHASWQGARTYHDDDEKGECFRVYEHVGASYNDHSLFLKRTRYAMLFELKITDYKGWARGLKKCGYATNPAYARLLIELIESHDLDSFDKEGVAWLKKGGVPASDLAADGAADTSKKSDAKGGVITATDSKTEAHNAVVESVAAAGLVLGMRDWGLSENNVVWVRAGGGDSFKVLARELDIMAWQLRKYNDLSKDANLQVDQRIYVQPKRRRGVKNWHVSETGETLRSISQRHGVKLSVLEKRNGTTADATLKAGSKVALRFKPNEQGEMPWWVTGN